MPGFLEHQKGHVHYQKHAGDGTFSSYLTCWWWAYLKKWFLRIEMDIYEFSLTRGVIIYTLWWKQINIFQNDYCSSSFSSWWISIFSKVNHSKQPLDMSWAKTKEISLEARRFQKYQSFLSFSAHNYETYFNWEP